MELKSFVAPDSLIAPVEWEYLSGLEKLAAAVRQRKFPCWAYSNKALAKLSEVPLETKEKLNKQIKNILLIMDTSPEIVNDPNSPIHPELGLIKEALKICQMRVRDDFWDNLNKDDVVEIYTMENIQLFRTFNFFNISSYSLLDLLINEWYLLWERPSNVIQSFMALYQDLVEGRITKTMKVNVPMHLLKEIYNDSNQENFKPTSVLVKPGVVSPLYDDQDNLKGFIFTLQGKVVGHGADTDNVSIL